MFFKKRQEVLDAIAIMGSLVCSYFMGENPDKWPTSFCDCKYGFKNFNGHGEQTGCPELRSIYEVLNSMTDDEWKDLAHRNDNIFISDIIGAPDGESSN